MRGKKRCTAQEFDAIRPRLENLKKRNVHAIQETLAGGRAPKAVAAELEFSNEAARRMAGKVSLSPVERDGRPEGRLSIGVMAPDLADLVTDMARQTKARLKQQEFLVKP